MPCIMFSIFFIYAHIRRNTCVCICGRSARPQKYVDVVSVELQEELRIRCSMKYWSRSTRAEHLVGKEGRRCETDRYTPTRCSLQITHSALWSPSSGGEQTDSKAQQHRLHADPDWSKIGMFSMESFYRRNILSCRLLHVLKMRCHISTSLGNLYEHCCLSWFRARRIIKK